MAKVVRVSWIGVIVLSFLLITGNAMALTDEERLQKLEDKFLNGEISEDIYRELREKYQRTSLATAGPYSSDTDTVLLMHFDEGKGLPEDSSGFGHSCEMNLATWTADGKFGSGLQFDGVDDEVRISYDESLSFNGKITCEAWIKNLGRGGSNYQTIMTIPGEYLFSLSPDSQQLKVYNWEHLKHKDISVNFDFLDGKWHHVAFTYDGTTRKIYIDGELKKSDTPSGTLPPSGNPLQIGKYYGGTEFNGIIDEVRISKTIRTFSISSVE